MKASRNKKDIRHLISQQTKALESLNILLLEMGAYT